MPAWMVVAYLACTVLSIAACLSFIVILHVSSRGDWRRSALGRHSMALAAATCYPLLLTLLRGVLGDYPGRQYLLLTGFAVLSAVLCWRVVLLIREQRVNRDEE